MEQQNHETLIFEGDAVPVDLAFSLDDLLAICFGGMRLSQTPPATRHALILHDGGVAVHAAVQARTFPIAGQGRAGYILGFVCTHPQMRHQGLGTAVVQALLRNLDSRQGGFVVLNCGINMVRFYEQMRFVMVAERAAYVRQGRWEVDADPVLGIALAPGYDLTSLRCDVFPIGEDF
jgi:predicted N-acetyltransferase YhbS